MKPLTRRQREVLVCLLLGLGCKETGRRLGIGRRTVEGHRERILFKYGTKRGPHLVWKLFNEGEGNAEAVDCA